jgi:hypothetical protein
MRCAIANLYVAENKRTVYKSQHRTNPCSPLHVAGKSNCGQQAASDEGLDADACQELQRAHHTSNTHTNAYRKDTSPRLK